MIVEKYRYRYQLYPTCKIKKKIWLILFSALNIINMYHKNVKEREL